MPNYVSKLIMPNSNEYVIKATSIDNMIWYGTCPTAAATAAKVATVDDDFTLTKGAVAFINFTYTNSASTPTLNINNTGAKQIRYYENADTPATVLSPVGLLRDGTNKFVYDGTYWVLDANTNNKVTQSDSTVNEAKQILFSPASGSSTSGTTSTVSKSANLLFNPSSKVLTVGTGGQITAPTVYATTKLSTNLIDTQSGDTIQATQSGLTISPDTALIVEKGLNSLTVNSSTITLSYNGVRELVIGSSGFNLYDDYGEITSSSSGLSISSSNLSISSTDSTLISGDYVTIDDGYNNELYMDDTGIGMYSGYNYIRLNNQPIVPTITLYFGQAGLYKDAARTTLYTTGDYANDIMDKNPILVVNGGGNGSLYPATYYYEKDGNALDYARITCLVNEANTLYEASASYSTGAETFSVSAGHINKVPAGGTTGQVLTKTSNSDYAVGWANAGGGGSSALTGITNPTTSTQGDIGQMYLNTTTEIMYVCTYATSGTYHWKPITFESAESQVG